MEVCLACHKEKVVCGRCRKVFCSNCENTEYIDTPVAKGWFCVACYGGQTELSARLREFSTEHGSETLILTYKQTTLF